MAGKRKKSIPQKTRDFKINTRIIITSVLAIVIPILILAIAACIFVFTSMDRYDFTSINTESYNVVNQIQWSQTVNNIAAVGWVIGGGGSGEGGVGLGGQVVGLVN